MSSNAPLGEDAVGTEVARDFGEAHGGVFLGHVVSVEGRKRKFYHVRYTDGDEEDLDQDEFAYAFEFAQRERGSGDVADGPGERGNGRRGQESSSSSNEGPSRARPTFGAEPKWHNVSTGGRRFKPVLTRERMRNDDTGPRFRPPCRESGDISPHAFSLAFLPDEIVNEIAKNSETYRKTRAVINISFRLYVGKRLKPYACLAYHRLHVIESAKRLLRQRTLSYFFLRQCTWGLFVCPALAHIGLQAK